MRQVLVMSSSAITQAGLATLITEESDQWQVVGAATQLRVGPWPAPAADCALVSWPPLEDGRPDLDRLSDLSIPMVALLETGSNLALPELLHHGLAGLLPGQANGADIVAALEAAAAGLIALHPALLDSLLAGNGERPPTAPLGQGEALTPREVEVLALLAEGLSNKAIARRLHLSDHTVKYHTSAIFAKLNVSSRTEAAIAGARAGLILL